MRGMVACETGRIMRNSIMRTCYGLAILTLVFPSGAEPQGSATGSTSVRQFVQNFYSWYVPKALDQNESRAWNLALKYKTEDFSPELAKLLSEDSAAQAKCEELVGIDFDPFLNSQDPAQHYEVGLISQDGQHYFADIHSIEGGKRSEHPRVKAEVARSNGRWVFTNFLYLDGTDLLSILKSPRPKCGMTRPPGI
jgi:hypothetical protein